MVQVIIEVNFSKLEVKKLDIELHYLPPYSPNLKSD